MHTFAATTKISFLLLGACSTSPENRTTESLPACGMTIYTSEYDPSCQRALDKTCCSQERACAANPSCVNLIHCLNKCPRPRNDACLDVCAGDMQTTVNTPGYSELAAIAMCSAEAPYLPEAYCGWPN